MREVMPLTLRRKVALAFEILVVYVEARWALRRDDLPAALAQVRDRRLVAGLGLDRVEGIRLGRAVERVLGRLPFDSRCLVRSLVVSSLLARRCTPSSLVIGVRPGEEFLAHAWVELDGEEVLPSGRPSFQRLAAL